MRKPSHDCVVRDLPSGAVTLLFTDIEGSTRLLHELGDGYADAIAEHRRVRREAFGAQGGVEVDTQGDAFLSQERDVLVGTGWNRDDPREGECHRPRRHSLS